MSDTTTTTTRRRRASAKTAEPTIAEQLAALTELIAAQQAQIAALTAARPTRASRKPADPGSDDARFTVQDGRRTGFIELVFDGKPSPTIRDAIKIAGFRFNAKTTVWYGPESSLPQIKGYQAKGRKQAAK